MMLCSIKKYHTLIDFIRIWRMIRHRLSIVRLKMKKQSKTYFTVNVQI